MTSASGFWAMPARKPGTTTGRTRASNSATVLEARPPQRRAHRLHEVQREDERRAPHGHALKPARRVDQPLPLERGLVQRGARADLLGQQVEKAP